MTVFKDYSISNFYSQQTGGVFFPNRLSAEVLAVYPLPMYCSVLICDFRKATFKRLIATVLRCCTK